MGQPMTKSEQIKANPQEFLRPEIIEKIAKGRPGMVGISVVADEVWETLVAMAILVQQQTEK